MALAAVLLAAVLLAAAIGVVFWVRHDLPPGQGPDPGRAAAERYIRDYINSLNTNEAAGLGRLLDKPAESVDVRQRLTQYGGRGLVPVQLTMINDFPRVYQVSITARAADGAVIRMREVIEWATDRWHMAPLVTPAPT